MAGAATEYFVLLLGDTYIRGSVGTCLTNVGPTDPTGGAPDPDEVEDDREGFGDWCAGGAEEGSTPLHATGGGTPIDCGGKGTIESCIL